MPIKAVKGNSPLILALPHASSHIPEVVMDRLNATGRSLADTDWHIDQLFDGLSDDATIIIPAFHRYMCNANGDPTLTDAGSVNSADAVVPFLNLDGAEIWHDPPSTAEIRHWRAAFHAPYHAALASQIARVRANHGYALLLDCHAARVDRIGSVDPSLPDIRLHTNTGVACSHSLAADVGGILLKASGYHTKMQASRNSSWTVARHGRPKLGVHALKIEIARPAYLTAQEDGWHYDPARAEALRNLLARALRHMEVWVPDTVGATRDGKVVVN
ncbi:N-formylglutamate deformylase [Roseobacter cerasinus]|uniref:N-formylglutamate deformylase n=1 Tax=Roseobacter cerasinus TaxID=2602289 RepID=A0A640VVN1_9RHOB|nr:N-formylglutamate amidohydrolase [Roseobacter cerasinus]GFE51460.1 N-formylglutamate deformylase [Roseobacter cerasinus]